MRGVRLVRTMWEQGGGGGQKSSPESFHHITTGLVARKLTKLPPVVQKIPLAKGGWISTCWGFYGFLKLIFKLSFKVFPCALGPFRPSMFEKLKVPSAHLNQFAQKREAFCRKAICLCSKRNSNRKFDAADLPNLSPNQSIWESI